ncbi:MAG: tetratricopeptide repeat protein [Muribaculum sp.]|nr:tetratricopeptide repeat protein [Muribaculum sp.]
MRLTAMLSLGSAIIPAIALGQAHGTTDYTDPLAPGYIYRASKMLSTGNAQGTLDQLQATADDFKGFTSELKAKWLANEGAALFERKDPECVLTLTRLANEYPTLPEATQALLTIGDWYWYEKDWHKAIERYDEVDLNSLGKEQRNLYTYRKALAYLNCGLPEQATPLFESLKGMSDYNRAAEYYSAYINYLQGDYDQAYNKFRQLVDDAADNGVTNNTSSSKAGRAKAKRGNHQPAMTPGNGNYISDGIEPLYYMTQIEYMRGQYDDVINHANALMAKRPVEELLPELHRIIGLSQFKTGDLASARGHLEEFVDSTPDPNDDAVYALAAIEYSEGDTENARNRFRTLTDRNNMLAQGAYLYLGQIAERNGDMNEAAMAFNKAATMAFDPKVAETASYNYITSSSKGGNVPFASSITMHEDFLEKYPSSPYASAVEESLASAFFHENDYAKALEAINRVNNPSAGTLATKQKILYKLGCGEISTGQLQSAADHLREAAEMKGGEASLASEAYLWLGEALYRQGNFKDAANAYTRALRGNLSDSNKAMARYGLAYALFQDQQWKEAADNFTTAAGSNLISADIKGDALIREADSRLYMKQFSKAADTYERAIKDGHGDIDYAAFRHAVVAGVTSGTDRKMTELDSFLKERPESKWTPEVLLEAGKTLAALDRPEKAAPYFERLRKEYPQNNQSRAGALQLALSYMKQGDTTKAETTYKDIIRTWPTSEEASLANDDMRRIAGANGTLLEYAEFLSGIKGAPQIDPDEMDAITFEAAETEYADNPEATLKLERYIEQYPDGRYLANALMDLAEAADNSGDSKKALSYLDRLLTARGDSPQVPAALYLKADLLQDAGDKTGALEAFLALEKRGGMDFAPEATAGVMRNTADAQQRAEYARRLIAMGGVSAEDAEEARYYEASGLLHSSDPETGVKALEALAENPDNLSGAKAAVELGEWYLEKGMPTEALSVLEKFTDAGSIHAYWLARGFIALADAYHETGNDYLAAEYLKSLRDNYPGSEQDITDSINIKISEYSK